MVVFFYIEQLFFKKNVDRKISDCLNRLFMKRKGSRE